MNIKRTASWKTTDGRSQTRDDKLIKGTTVVRLLTCNEKSQKLVYAAEHTVQAKVYSNCMQRQYSQWKPCIYLNELSNGQTVRINEHFIYLPNADRKNDFKITRLLCYHKIFHRRQLTSTVISSNLIKALSGIFPPAYTEFQKIYHCLLF